MSEVKSGFRRLLELTDKSAREELNSYYIISESRMDNYLNCLEDGAKQIAELRAQLSEAQKENEEFKTNAYAVAKDLRERMNEQDALWQETAQHLLERAEKLDTENAELREQLKKVEEAKEYKDHEFCKDVECGAFDNGRCHARQCCYRTAKHFHRWLKQNGYKIIKSECKKGE
jgi:predicted nuclease with TOPRIM domain